MVIRNALRTSASHKFGHRSRSLCLAIIVCASLSLVAASVTAQAPAKNPPENKAAAAAEKKAAPAPANAAPAAATTAPAAKKEAPKAPAASPGTANPSAANPAGTAPPADGAAPGTAPAEAVVAPPPPAPGFVVINVDMEGLSAVVGGEVHGLKIGANRFELPAGDAVIEVQDKKGKSIKKETVTVNSGKDTDIKIVMTGKLVVRTAEGMTVKLDGKAVKAESGAASATVKGGKHSVVVTQPGRVGVKSNIDVIAGRTHTINPSLATFSPGNENLAWAGVLGGGALILAAVLMERFADATSFGGDTTRWVMVGAGVAGFASGTIMMKDIYKKEANPPVKDGKLPMQVTRAKSATANLAAR